MPGERGEWLKALEDMEELNNLLNADPELKFNMEEMGFIKKLPFQLDHNGATVSKYDWTDYGLREMAERLGAGAAFAISQGKMRLQ